MLRDISKFRLVSSSAVSPAHVHRSKRKTALWADRDIVTMAFILFVMFVGGSSRLDMTSLVLLRPIAILVFAGALITLPSSVWKDRKGLMFFVAAIIALPAIQLVPLPPDVWHSLAGRELVVSIDAAADIGPLWRPISLSPAGTWNALYSLSVPCAVLFMGLALDHRGRRLLVPFVLALILASAILGVLQVAGPRGSPLYFYRVTHSDSAVGFLANRNHQAAFLACGFPILAFLASDREFSSKFYGRPVAALVIGSLLVPLLMVTGSRMGLVVGVCGVVTAVLIYWKGLSERGLSINSRDRIVLLGSSMALIGVAVATIALGRAEAVSRLLGWDDETDVRFRLWASVIEFGPQFWPWGTGFGTFTDVYKIFEPNALLNPKYFNQAHNDWIEVILSGGLWAALLLAVAVLAWLRRTWQVAQRSPGKGADFQLARTGLTIVLLFAIASITDYPLRVPSLVSIFVLAALWSLTSRSTVGND